MIKNFVFYEKRGFSVTTFLKKCCNVKKGILVNAEFGTQNAEREVALRQQGESPLATGMRIEDSGLRDEGSQQ